MPQSTDEPTPGGSSLALIIIVSLVIFGLLLAFIAVLITINLLGLGHIDG